MRLPSERRLKLTAYARYDDCSACGANHLRRFMRTAVILFLVSVVTPAGAVTQARNSSIENALRSTVTILTIGSTGDTLALGSGFFLAPGGVLVSNWHVMSGANRAVIVLADGSRYDRVTFIAGDPVVDVALLRVRGGSFPVLPSSRVVPAVGTRIVVIGSPLGLAQTVSDGLVSGVRNLGGRDRLQMSAPISPGSSGGPVLSPRGEVVAIATSSLVEGQQINFAVPIQYALNLLHTRAVDRPLAEAFLPTARPLPERPLDRPGVRTGVYRVLSTLTRSRGVGVRDSTVASPDGVLVLTTKVGWWRRNQLSMPVGRDSGQRVVPVRRLASPDDSIRVLIGETLFSGRFQHDELFLSSNPDSGTASTRRLSIWGRASTDHEADSAAVARVYASTRIATDSVTWGPIGWRGQVALVREHDTIYIALNLDNEAARAAVWFFSGLLQSNGSFAVEARDSTRRSELRGRTQGASLSGTWFEEVQDSSSTSGLFRFRGPLWTW